MKLHILIDWEAGSVIGAFENFKDAQDTKKESQFPRFHTIETCQSIKPSTKNSILTELEGLRKLVEHYPVEYNRDGVRKCFDSIADIDDEIKLVMEEEK